MKINPRAFGSKTTDYYELQIDLGILKKGAIFYYDPNDSKKGSVASGCIKLAWTEDGDCQNSLCADTIVFHASYRFDETMFRRIVCPLNTETINKRHKIIDSIINSLEELKSTF